MFSTFNEAFSVHQRLGVNTQLAKGRIRNGTLLEMRVMVIAQAPA